MKAISILILSLFLTHAVDSNEANSKTLTLKEGEKGEPARIEDMAWLAGHWMGDGLGGVSEEFWTKPSKDSMTGLFRLVKDGKTVFQELFIIAEKENTLILKLKHFHPDLTGWEEKNQTVDFPLVRLASNEAYFNGLTYRKLPDGRLQIYLKLRQKDGATVEEEFLFKRIS